MGKKHKSFIIDDPMDKEKDKQDDIELKQPMKRKKLNRSKDKSCFKVVKTKKLPLTTEIQPKKEMDDRIVSSSAIEFQPENLKDVLGNVLVDKPGMVLEKNSKVGNERFCEKGNNSGILPKSPSQLHRSEEGITLLLFYQYVEPLWDDAQFQNVLNFVTTTGQELNITGRMRVSREGLNCTLTGSSKGIREWCAKLRMFDGGRSKKNEVTGEKITEFANTEFKLTDNLPPKQCFPKLHAFEVVELVNYGLVGSRVPEISKHGGTHLEPEEYHKKLFENDTVVIDVRNHYEANIGRFMPPPGGARVIDPMMRKSTEFPIWLDKKETKEMLRGKQVLMYCTGGVRCERASALLKQKIEMDQDTKELGIIGVYQLQGGIDKYFKKFPEGGFWRGKNYVFDKRFAHAPPAIDAVEKTIKKLGCEIVTANPDIEVKGDTKSITVPVSAVEEILSHCEACSKPWDMYRGKRRCPTCGVPSLICRECFESDKLGIKKLGKEVRCDLCVKEDIKEKRELREREVNNAKEYELKLQHILDTEYVPPSQRKHALTRKPKPNPERITRLFLKNMCADQMNETKLLEFLRPAKVTHIQWLTDRNTGKFYGSAFIEVKTAEDAGSVLSLDGAIVFGRKITIKYQQANEKDFWPPSNTKVCHHST